MKPSKTKRLHYWLTESTVVFIVNETQQPQTASFNNIIRNDQNFVSSKKIGETQQAAQMMFFQKIGEEQMAQVTVVDVVLGTVSYLGYMTHEEFHDIPEPQAQGAADAASPEAANGNDTDPSIPEELK